MYGSKFTFTNPYRWNRTTDQTGIYLQDQMKWNQWFLTFGGRCDWAKTDTKETGGKVDAKDEKFSGRAASATSSATASCPMSATPSRSSRSAG
ncbi:TonB-dependent receptor [Pseudomonas aeruginosa]|nr:TonB-dependent receptor [Pseudomonas aeruginosa]